MTTSPLLPSGTAGRVAEAEATAAELNRMTELALSRGACTIAFAAIGAEHVIGLAGAHTLPGLAGATADGGTWQVSHGILQVTPCRP